MKSRWQWTHPASVVLLVTGAFVAGVLCIDTPNGFRAIAVIAGCLCIATLIRPRMVAGFSIAVSALIVLAALTSFASRLSPTGEDLGSRLLMLVLPILPGAILAMLSPPRESAPNRTDDPTRCRFCGYSLVGLQSGQCPECGYFAPAANTIPHTLHRPAAIDLVAMGCQLWGASVSVLLLTDGPSNNVFIPALIYLLSCVATMLFRRAAAWITLILSVGGLVAGILVGALSGLATAMLLCGLPGVGALVTIESDRLCSKGRSECPLCRQSLIGPATGSPDSPPLETASHSDRVIPDRPRGQ